MIENLFGIVVETVDGFEILSDEKGLLFPCSELPAEFKKEEQPVIVSWCSILFKKPTNMENPLLLLARE
jgi:hypothetical protein